MTVVVVNNGAFSWIEAGQRNFDDFSFAVSFDRIDFAAVTEDLSVNGYRVTDADDYLDTLETAVSNSEPALIDVPTKPVPEIDPIPVYWLEPES